MSKQSSLKIMWIYDTAIIGMVNKLSVVYCFGFDGKVDRVLEGGGGRGIKGGEG